MSVVLSTMLLLLPLPLLLHLPPPTSNQEQVSLGQTKYTELTQASSMPKYGPCWMRALAQLQTSCDQLTDGSHSR